jgi:hypothetical protein
VAVNVVADHLQANNHVITDVNSHLNSLCFSQHFLPLSFPRLSDSSCAGADPMCCVF